LLVLDLTEPVLLHRYAALLHDIGKKQCAFTDEQGKIHFHQHEIVSETMAKKILSRLTCSHQFTEETAFIIKNHMRFKTAGEQAEIISDKALRRIILQAGSRWDALLDVIHADNCAHAEAFSLPEQITMLKERVKKLNFPKEKQKMPIDGNIVKSRFSIKEGKKVGEMLEKAEEIWLENPEISSEELIKKLEQPK
jgi:poly(A) polymerase